MLHLTRQEMTQLKNVALGREKADLAVINARLVNVYTGEIQEGCGVAVKGCHIALTAPDIAATIGPGTRVIDAGGRTLIPGLIDGHAHLGMWATIHEYLPYVMTGGTTTIITETLEIYPVGGYEGLMDFIGALRDQPIKLLATAPAMVSITEDHMGVPPDIMQKLALEEDVVGIGESYWQHVIQAPDYFLANYETMLRAGKTVEGHSAGAKGSRLAAYSCLGITSCHEPITADEALERLRMGLHVMVREGSIRRDLEAVSAILEHPIDTRRLILVTDGISPDDLLDMGYMEYPVQKAIDCGFDPVCAIQMATLNVAEHFKLDHAIGGIAPGKLADMVLIPEPSQIKAEMVISNGQVIAENGRLETPARRHEYQPRSLNSVHLPREMTAEDFKIKVPAGTSEAHIRIIEMITDLVSKETAASIAVTSGEIICHPGEGLAKVSTIDRTITPGKQFTGIIKGFGITQGAMALSAAWDTSCIVAVGASDSDMAQAVNRVKDLKGGIVLCLDGKILVEMPLPVFGIISDLPLQQMAEKIEEIITHAKTLGISFPDPLLSLSTLTGAAIPFFRICEKGLVNFKDGVTRDLFIND